MRSRPNQNQKELAPNNRNFLLKLVVARKEKVLHLIQIPRRKMEDDSIALLPGKCYFWFIDTDTDTDRLLRKDSTAS